jgi:hypothetical protein
MNENNSYPDPWDVLSAAEPYWVGLPGTVAEFVKFGYGFNALVWLYRKLDNDISTEIHRLEALRESGQHQVPNWTAESDLVLDESVGTLQDASQISFGTIIAACSSALESLFTDLLPKSSSGRRALRGLVTKAQALVTTWPDAEEAAKFLEHVKWLSERRNSFVHQLIDEGGAWDPVGTHYDFYKEAVEETFERVGEVVTMLEEGYDAYRSREGF